MKRAATAPTCRKTRKYAVDLLSPSRLASPATFSVFTVSPRPQTVLYNGIKRGLDTVYDFCNSNGMRVLFPAARPTCGPPPGPVRPVGTTPRPACEHYWWVSSSQGGGQMRSDLTEGRFRGVGGRSLT